MQDLQQQRITESGPVKGGNRLQTATRAKTQSAVLEMVGKQYGKLIVSSGEVIRKGKSKRAHITTTCVNCGSVSVKDLQSVIKNQAGCRKCDNYAQAPKWLALRCNGAKQRCENEKNQAYERYGARGIKFKFDSPMDMAVWIAGNLGLDRTKQIDRIDNNGHYEKGNLRLVTPNVNQCNTRGFRATALMHKFRMEYPEIKYADATIVNLLVRGLSFVEIAERFMKKSNKPKGVYGTYSTPDPVIASLSQGY